MDKSQEEKNQEILTISQQLTDAIQAELDREQNVQLPTNIPQILSLANELKNSLEEVKAIVDLNQATTVGEVNSEDNINTNL